MHLSTILTFSLLGIAWLIPNHYFPWPVFWSDLFAAIAFAGILVKSLIEAKAKPKVPLIAMGALLLSLVPVIQWSFGQIYFAGDAWMASLYLLGFGLAAACPAIAQRTLRETLGALAWTVMLTALISVGLALCQWLSLDYLGLFLMSLPPDGRPYANLAQPNQLATLLMLGVVSAAALYQFHKLNAFSLGWVISLLCFGVAMTQSRTAWLEMGGLVVWMLVMRDRAALRINRSGILAMALLFSFFVAMWPTLCEVLYLTPGRTLQGQFEGDLRGQLWSSMLDAIIREPWFGYGWNQVSVAQAHVAINHPATGVMIEHSHNIALDLLVWNGLPLGLLIIAGLAFWFWQHIRACRDATVALLLGGIGVVMVHGLLEFPLEYAYFLLPIGFMMGAVELLSPAGRFMAMPKAFMASLAALAVGLLVWTAIEYMSVEENHRQLRFELAGFGRSHTEAQVFEIVLLSQLGEFPQFARTEAKRNMSREQLDKMRKMAERYGFPPVLFRYALAAGLNGEPGVAENELALLCKVHPKERCVEGIDAWKAMAAGPYPELRAVVRLPALPISGASRVQSGAEGARSAE